MIVERTLDVGECLTVLTNKEIFNAISEDGATMDYIKIDVLNDIWLAVDVDCECIGIVQLKRMFNKCYDSHIHILPEFRKEHSVGAGELILEWCKKEISGSLLYTNVPEFCGNVKNFLLNFGFTEQGILPNAWRKNGKMNNMTILTKEV